MIRKIILPLFFFGLFITTAKAQNQRAFGDALFAEQDYFRAISIYKELLFNATDKTEKIDLNLAIARAYIKSQKPNLAIYHISKVFSDTTRTFNEEIKASTLLSLCYHQQSNWFMAKNALRPYINDDSPTDVLLLNALYTAEEGDLDGSEKLFNQASRNLSEPLRLKIATGSIEKIGQLKNIPQKNETLAVLFSAIIPGSGQFYTGNQIDGIQAAGMFFLFGFSTYASFKYEDSRHHGYPMSLISLGITGMVYYANLEGAYLTARFYNRRQQEDAMVDFRTFIFSVDF